MNPQEHRHIRHWLSICGMNHQSLISNAASVAPMQPFKAVRVSDAAREVVQTSNNEVSASPAGSSIHFLSSAI
jgi:hypothetical protein